MRFAVADPIEPVSSKTVSSTHTVLRVAKIRHSILFYFESRMRRIFAKFVNHFGYYQ